jgi:hypothetical protein
MDDEERIWVASNAEMLLKPPLLSGELKWNALAFVRALKATDLARKRCDSK